MKKEIDVIAVFDSGAMYPRPIRFRVVEKGIKRTVDITDIKNANCYGAGGQNRITFDCFTVINAKRIEYKLNYYFNTLKWEVIY